MSLDYPSREDWLKVRATPVKLPHKGYAYISAKIYWVPELKDPKTGMVLIRGHNAVAKGQSFEYDRGRANARAERLRQRKAFRKSLKAA